MLANDLLIDVFGRVRDGVNRSVEGLSEDDLAFRPDDKANSIAWLVWHLARVQDNHIAGAAQAEQVWVKDGWSEKFGLPFERMATGYGQASDDVAAVRASEELLGGYYDAVYDQTQEYLKSLNEDDYSKVIDENWDPPVMLAVRLVSVASDTLQHAGQAGYVRGLFSR
ncbi:MAG: mycothiol transferase [Candidatus Saccharimonadales bacterium]